VRVSRDKIRGASAPRREEDLVASKLLVKDAAGVREVPVAGAVVVGRDADCTISDDSPLLSRRHAEFVAYGLRVQVRDLNSRNGIYVNGARVAEAWLNPGDLIEIAPLVITFAGHGAADLDRDATSLAELEVVGGAARETLEAPRPIAAAAPALQQVRIAPPSARQATAHGQNGSAARAADRSSSARSFPAAVDDKTNLVDIVGSAPRAPGVSPAAPAPQPAAPALHGEPEFPTPRAGAGDARRASSKPPAASWETRVLARVAGLAAIVAVAAALPLEIRRAQAVAANGDARAIVTARWLAAEAATALAAGAPLDAALDAVANRPGVVSASIIAADGKVLAPAAQADQRVDRLPALDVSPGAVLRPITRAQDGVIHAAAPVLSGRGGAPPVARLTFNPNAAGGGFGLMSVLLLMLVGGGGVLLATRSITRLTLGSIVTFNEEVEHAVCGRLDEVRDPMGSKPTGALADSVNYLLARLRARPAAGAAAAPFVSGLAETSAQTFGDARIVADRKFRIVEASPGCAHIVGRPSAMLVGEHLVDAISDKPIADGIVQCLAKLANGGEHRAFVASASRGLMSISVSRAGGDAQQRVTVVIKPETVTGVLSTV
jgi:pSer/pThr/pTyr-binding forkhead associated (FHA) protein